MLSMITSNVVEPGRAFEPQLRNSRIELAESHHEHVEPTVHDLPHTSLGRIPNLQRPDHR